MCLGFWLVFQPAIWVAKKGIYVVAVSIVAKVRFAVGALIAGFVLAFSATPSFANSSANADIAAPLRAAQAAKAATQPAGDAEFRSLFGSWRSMDQGTSFAAITDAVRSVSIPSLMPVEGIHMTSNFGMRWHPVLGGHRAHKGVDLAGAMGTPVHATADGVVGRADWFSGYGLYVQLEHGANLETRYGHMSRLNVEAGQFVHKGDVVGFIGSTGRSTGPHLHYEVRIAGMAVNPIPYMQGEVAALPAGLPVAGADVSSEADAGDE
jgi:murein DD-endopeptidase MepM/ murein hydrolase activator NlpD